MQAVWSRAGQARHCGCKARLNAAGGMIRQSATRATQRKPTFSEIFTACYTSIMGTAAVLDAKRKDTRRKKLDQQLEEAKAELARLMENAPPEIYETAPAGSISNRYKGALDDHKKQLAEVSQFFDALGNVCRWPKPLLPSKEVEWLREEYGFGPTYDSITGQKQSNYLAMEKWLIREEEEPNVRHRIPTNLRQLRTSAVAVRDMVQIFLDNSEVALGSEAAKGLRRDIAKLKQGNFKKFPNYDQGTSMEEIKECSLDLNKTLRGIFKGAERGHIQSLLDVVKKVCFKLLTSPHPPTIHTFNTLIVGFDRAGLHPLADTAVNCFYRSRLEPTQNTLVFLLNHFKETGEVQKFKDVIDRMTGKDFRGINIRRKLIEDVAAHDQLMKWAQTKDVAIGRKWVVERAKFDVQIFTAVIEGMLRFDYVRHAAATLSLGFQLGYCFGLRTVKQLLDQCVYSLDAKAAFEILKAFASKPMLVKGFFCRESDQPYLVERLQNLLDICGITGSTPTSLVQWLQNCPASLTPPADKPRRGLQIARIAVRLEVSEKKIQKLKRTLDYIRQSTMLELGAAQKSDARCIDKGVMVEARLGSNRHPTAGEKNDQVEISDAEKRQMLSKATIPFNKTDLLSNVGRVDPWVRLQGLNHTSNPRRKEVLAASF
ncbi:hypothetical protein CCHL11_01380 [Colletotrichum chlorophyti]|uniref:Uncharacterized protein n=1 Tax=Colletotrichum chlorophyti TaxID=708187 RepID=A0A1Q8RYR1_9PEZI|nr:hypothetical protein CCHL11_01380 [Colletotrichum chlorophyti]